MKLMNRNLSTIHYCLYQGRIPLTDADGNETGEYRVGYSEASELCPTLSDPMECSPPGSSIHGIFQARVLEWGAIAFSN